MRAAGPYPPRSSPRATICRRAGWKQSCRRWCAPAFSKACAGPSGGYALARERRRLCVGEIVRVALRAEEDEGAGGRRCSPPCWSR